MRDVAEVREEIEAREPLFHRTDRDFSEETLELRD